MAIEDEQAAFQSGDPDGFRRVFRAYSPLLMAICLRILRDRQDAEDVTSDVFLEAWSRRHQFDPSRSSLRGYLTVLARSRALDRYRSRSRYSEHIHRFSNDENCHGTTDSASFFSTGRPDEMVANNELRGLAKNAIRTLSESQRVPLELSFYEGMSHSEIATHLNIPLGTVKSHIRKGMEKLRHVLRRLSPEPTND